MNTCIMRIRKSTTLLGAAIIMVTCLTLYIMLDTLSLPNDDALQAEIEKNELSALESRLRKLEGDLMKNHDTIQEIKTTVQELMKENTAVVSIRAEKQPSGAYKFGKINKTFAIISRNDCGFEKKSQTKTDIQMLDVYQEIKFENQDGGAWKQGWDVSYDPNLWNAEKKLKVFVVPHSHNDPGWIKTFEKYYHDQTKFILGNMVKKLGEDSRRKFIWAEISFFSLWWDEQPSEIRDKVLEYLNNGQLEIVTGGWVMNDEANSHYFAMLEQMVVGHEWLSNNLNGYQPENGWAIDPFGMSPTMAYLLKRMGLENMVIQRVHYEVKKYLAKKRNLEFKWRQLWDSSETTDILCHMMPFYSYDIPHTCGPDPKVCCQFDFKRLPGGRVVCPWRVPPQPISEKNVAERAKLLLDQYRKKSQLYKTNVVMIPLGDDFRYDKASEWDQQFNNYQKLFDYMNKEESLHVEAQFGTLSNYFSAVKSEMEIKMGSELSEFSTLSGDFFTYADRDHHYWSGYFTSRPFYKNLDRVLESYLRSAEILFSMAWAEMEYVGNDLPEFSQMLMKHLVDARHNLGLFQHHDGITGTSKDHVVVDYANKMLKSITGLQTVIQQSAHYLLSPGQTYYEPKLEEIHFDLDDKREGHFSLPQKTTISIDERKEGHRIVIFNSIARKREEIVTFRVNSPNIKVLNVNGDSLPCQLSPVFLNVLEISNVDYDVSFVADVPALGLATYYIKQLELEEGKNGNMVYPTVKLINTKRQPYQVPPFENIEVKEKGKVFSLKNSYISASFNENGLLQSITTLDDSFTLPTELKFMKYGVEQGREMSGAYLFLPDGSAQVFDIGSPSVIIVEGTFLSEVEVYLPNVKHRIQLKNSPGVDGTGLEIYNLVDVTQERNFELMMRVSSGIKSGNEFFTDLNGYQTIKRKTLEKLPLQANYYPMPTSTYIQDESTRLTILTAQPLGVSSLNSGEVEVMMDRRLNQDDNRGVEQGVTDNHPTPNIFRLLIERKKPACEEYDSKSAAGYLSLLGHEALHSLLNPLHRLISTSRIPGTYNKKYEPTEKDLPCDIQLVNLRTMLDKQSVKEKNKPMPSNDVALSVRRVGFDCCYRPVAMTCRTNEGKINVMELFPELFNEKMRQMSLSLMYTGLEMEKSFTVSIQPMELYAFLLRR